MIFPIPLCASPLQFTTTDISRWISAYTCHSHDHSSSLLLLQGASKYYPLFRKFLELLPCNSFLMKNLTDNSSHLSRIRSFPLLMCLTKSFEMPFDPPKILCSLLLLKFLPAYIMVNSICLVAFFDIPCLVILSLMIQCVLMHAIIRLSFLKLSFRLRRPPGHELVLGNSKFY
jgi:hypothetical protein